MNNVFEKFLVTREIEKKNNHWIYILTEEQRTCAVENFTVKFNEKHFEGKNVIIINCDKLENKIQTALNGSNLNSKSSDFAIIVYESNDISEITLYLIELGPHDNRDLEKKFNSTLSTLTTFITKYFHNIQIFNYKIKYRLFIYDGKEQSKEMLNSQSKGYTVKQRKKGRNTVEYNYHCFTSGECNLRYLDNGGLKSIDIHGIEDIFISN